MTKHETLKIVWDEAKLLRDSVLDFSDEQGVVRFKRDPDVGALLRGIGQRLNAAFPLKAIEVDYLVKKLSSTCSYQAPEAITGVFGVYFQDFASDVLRDADDA